MRRKLIYAFTSVIIILTLCLQCFAGENAPQFGRVNAVMPEITAELRFVDPAQGEFSASLSGDALEIIGAEKFSREKYSTKVYLLADVSTSMKSKLADMKKCMSAYVNNMGDSDIVTIMTFGENVNTLIDSSSDKQALNDSINSLKCDEEGTLFYSALQTAYDNSVSASNSGYDREYIIVFSDGVDYQTGAATFDEANDKFKSRALPIYALCMSSVSQSSADKFGMLARASGGSLVMYKSVSDFNSLLDYIDDITIVKMSAKTNNADGSEYTLSVSQADKTAECRIPITRSVPDNEAPKVLTADFDPETNSFTVTFSEKVRGLSSVSSFQLTDANGAGIPVSAVSGSDEGTSVVITASDDLRDGDITISFPGVSDCSRERNTAQSVGVTVTGAKSHVSVWVIVIIVCAGVALLSAAAVIAIASMQKKNVRETSVVHVYEENKNQRPDDYASQTSVSVAKNSVSEPCPLDVSLKIKTEGGDEYTANLKIASSVIIGRSNACDLTIGDKKMSSQHFALEFINGGLFLSDLNSTNGTFINGARIRDKRKVLSGDKVDAGATHITVRFF